MLGPLRCEVESSAGEVYIEGQIMDWDKFSDVLDEANHLLKSANRRAEHQPFGRPNYLEFWVAQVAYRRGIEVGEMKNSAAESHTKSDRQRSRPLMLVNFAD
jgi:hypothetical protein